MDLASVELVTNTRELGVVETANAGIISLFLVLLKCAKAKITNLENEENSYYALIFLNESNTLFCMSKAFADMLGLLANSYKKLFFNVFGD